MKTLQAAHLHVVCALHELSLAQEGLAIGHVKIPVRAFAASARETSEIASSRLSHRRQLTLVPGVAKDIFALNALPAYQSKIVQTCASVSR